MFAVNLADSDPEFAILLRHTTRMKSVGGIGGGYLTVGGRGRSKVDGSDQQKNGRGGTHCPVLTVDLDSDGEYLSVLVCYSELPEM